MPLHPKPQIGMKLHAGTQPPLSPRDSQTVRVGGAVQGCNSQGLHILVGVLRGAAVRGDVGAHIEVSHSEVVHNEAAHSVGLVYGNIVGQAGVWLVLVGESVPRILHLQCTLHSCSHGRVELKVGALNAGGEEACGDESCD